MVTKEVNILNIVGKVTSQMFPVIWVKKTLHIKSEMCGWSVWFIQSAPTLLDISDLSIQTNCLHQSWLAGEIYLCDKNRFHTSTAGKNLQCWFFLKNMDSFCVLISPPCWNDKVHSDTRSLINHYTKKFSTYKEQETLNVAVATQEK